MNKEKEWDNQETKKQTRQPRGRPIKNVIKPIDATPEEIAKAISLAADKKLEAERKIKV